MKSQILITGATGKFDSVTNNIKTITGHTPRSFEDYVKASLDLFKQVA